MIKDTFEKVCPKSRNVKRATQTSDETMGFEFLAKDEALYDPHPDLENILDH